MTMSRRDTIMIAVLVNAALLCVLFLLATHEDPVQVPKTEMLTGLSMIEEAPVKAQIVPVQAQLMATPVDEVDHALAPYLATSHEVQLLETAPIPVVAAGTETERGGERTLIEITVKRGDALEKIARANGTSVTELRRLNGLANDKLSIGQVLKVPVAASAMVVSSVPVLSDDEYYTLQVGDSPWLIAKKFHVKLDDLLQMNALDEAKARNLRPGDKVRVR